MIKTREFEQAISEFQQGNIPLGAMGYEAESPKERADVDMSCELDEIFDEGSVTCFIEPDMRLKMCLRCVGGIWERVEDEGAPGPDQN
ncbi:MAG: hypothetical protein ACP5SH_08700 [Syntrophobacteraceae bacterium]